MNTPEEEGADHVFGSPFKLVPCNHFWLAVHYGGNKVIGICKRCKKRGEFGLVEWEELKAAHAALDKPTRV